MDKDEIRKKIWDLMEQKGIARFPRPVYGRIPNFEGAHEAAQMLKRLSAWKEAGVIKANPDSPQRPVRRLALEQGKVVYMAVPRLREEMCFVELDPKRLKGNEDRASSIKGAFRFGRQVSPNEMKRVDLIVAGSVAVNGEGARIGKAGGYSDLEYAIGREFGIVDEGTKTLSTVHRVQVVEHELPMLRHDFPLDYIITAEGVIETKRSYPKPTGIYWEDLPEEKLQAIPMLWQLREHRGA